MPACRRDGADLVLDVRVQPRASRSEIAGLHGDRLRIRLQAPPVDGRAPLLGINNRDLRSFEVSLDTTLALRDAVPRGRRLVTESGIAAPADVRRMRDAGIDAFLVGEAFMREPDPGAALRRLFFAA